MLRLRDSGRSQPGLTGLPVDSCRRKPFGCVRLQLFTKGDVSTMSTRCLSRLCLIVLAVFAALALTGALAVAPKAMSAAPVSTPIATPYVVADINTTGASCGAAMAR